MRKVLYAVGASLLALVFGYILGTSLSNMEKGSSGTLGDFSTGDFSSYEELVTWLEEDKTDTYLAKRADTIYCAESAIRLQESAAQVGFRLNLDIITREEYIDFYLETAVVSVPVDWRGWKGPWPELGEGKGHIVCSALIGDWLYYIEPRTDDVWSYGELVR